LVSGVYAIMTTGELLKTHNDHPYTRTKSQIDEKLIMLDQKDIDQIDKLKDFKTNIVWKSAYKRSIKCK